MARATLHNRAARRAAVFVITAAICLGAVWALPRVSTAAAGWVAAPPVREQTVRLAGGLDVVASPAESAPGARAATAAEAAPGDGTPVEPGAVRTVGPGIRFDMVGLLCDEPLPAGRHFTVSVRASEDGTSWGEWLTVDLEPGAVADGAPEGTAVGGPAAFTEPVWVGSARVLQVRADGTGAAAARLSGVRLMFLNTSGDADAGDRVASVLRRAVATVAGLGRAPSAVAMTTRPAIVTRAQWGANESLRGHDPEYAPVEMAFVHHTVNANSYTRAQAPGLVRGIYYYDVQALKWSDLGYNFLVDRYGTVYEGRYGGVGNGVIGAQVLGFNTGSTGIAMIGTFTSASPPAAMMSSLKSLLAWKLDVHHVDPQGEGRLVCRSTQKYTEGATVTFPAIAGHRQANYTACPGDALYRLLPSVRRAVAAMGLPKIYDVSTGTLALSPNGDGVQESTRLRFRTSAVSDWSVEVRDAAGVARRTFAGTGDVVSIVWDGRDEDGVVVPDGPYRLVARAAVAGADARPASVPLAVDTVPPAPTEVGVTPEAFSPNGDGHGDLATVRYATPEACAARVLVVDGDGAVLRTVTGWTYAPAGARRARWDGLVAAAGELVRAPEGRSLLRIETRDAAGNRAAAGVGVRLDLTLGFLRAAPDTISPNGDGAKDRTGVGFILTRRATVTLAVRHEGVVVRDLGKAVYDAGRHTVTWDGRLDDGSRAASGAYRLAATAASTMGTVEAGRWMMVDRYRPRLSAPAGVTVALGRRARITCTVQDPFSAKARLTATVRDRSGRKVAVLELGWVATGQPATVVWRPPLRRVYSVTLTAVDLGGNREAAATRVTVTVR